MANEALAVLMATVVSIGNEILVWRLSRTEAGEEIEKVTPVLEREIDVRV